MSQQGVQTLVGPAQTAPTIDIAATLQAMVPLLLVGMVIGFMVKGVFGNARRPAPSAVAPRSAPADVVAPPYGGVGYTPGRHPRQDEQLRRLGEYRVLETQADGGLTVMSQGYAYVVTTEGQVYQEVALPAQ